MKYLFTARGLNEPDYNTPSDEIWCKLVECEPSEVERYAKVFKNDMAEDYVNGVVVEYRPLEMFKDEWVKVSVIW